MTLRLRRSLVPAIALLTFVSIATHAGTAAVTTDFAAGPEGWSIVDLNCTNYSVIATYSVDWLPTGGFPGGHIGAEDPSSNCYFFEAPPAYLGDRADFIGRTLRFALRSTVSNWPPGSIMILVGPSNLRLVHTFAQPSTEWSCFTVPLVNTAFRVGNAGGAVATPAQFASVMGDLAALRISAEHGSAIIETAFLDSVIFGATACAADLNGDGVVDGADIGVFLQGWGSDSSRLDFNCDGAIDGADLGLLLAAWGPCPR